MASTFTKLPENVLSGALTYQGTWNANTNSPSLASGVGTKGHYYVVSVAGSTNLDGITTWAVGDWAVYNGTVWERVDNSVVVASVFGRTGAVTAQSNDYTWAQVDKTTSNIADITTKDHASLDGLDDTDHYPYTLMAGTGLVSGGSMSINADTTKFDVAAGTGVVMDIHSDPANPTYTAVSWGASTANTVTNIATQQQTAIGIDSGGNIVQYSATFPTAEEGRDYITLGFLVHPNLTNISGISNQPLYGTASSVVNTIADMNSAIGPIVKSGVNHSANGANLKIDRSAGEIFFMGSNFQTSKKAPNTFSVPSATPVTFLYTWRDGAGGFNTGAAFTTDILPGSYDDGTGGSPNPNGSVSTNTWTIQRIYYSTSIVGVHYGQATYNSKADAIDGVQTEAFSKNPALDGSSFRGWLIVRGGASDLSDSGDAVFINAGKFGDTVVSGGSGAITNLQQSYNNSTTPEIVVDSTRGALTIRDNATPIGSALLEVENNGGTTRSFHVEEGAVGVNTSAPQTDFEVVGDIISRGTEWTAYSSNENSLWQDVIYGNNRFVAVSRSGYPNMIGTSQDGRVWTDRTAPANNEWQSVTYGNGLFVAVSSTGTGDRVMTSPDGITWTSRTSAANNSWQDVTYGNGVFAAVGTSGTGNRVMTSNDGINWSTQSSTEDNLWEGIAYGNGTFVAVSADGTNRVMTSTDGITWTARSAAAANQWYGVTYGKGLFVAVASSGTGNRVMTSPDGITWTIRTSAADSNWTRVAYGDGLFVAIASTTSSTNIMTSPDGINWVTRTNPTGDQLTAITYGNGTFVATSPTTPGNEFIISGAPIEILSPETNLKPKGEMYMYEESQTVTINTANVYHAVLGFNTGDVEAFTFDAGRVVDADISAEANPSANVLRITTSAAHNLTTGDVVSQTNMNDAGHNGITRVTVVDSTNYDCDDITYVAGAGASAGVVDEPSYLEAGTGAAGEYLLNISITGESVGTGKLFKWEVFKNATEQNKLAVERNHANTDTGNMGTAGFIEIAEGDRVFLAAMNKTDTTDFTLEHVNFNLHRI